MGNVNSGKNNKNQNKFLPIKKKCMKFNEKNINNNDKMIEEKEKKIKENNYNEQSKIAILKNNKSDYNIYDKDNKVNKIDNYIESKNKIIDNDKKFDDIEINLNINGCNNYLNKNEDAEEDEQGLIFFDYEDNDDEDEDFENHKIKKGKNELNKSYISLDSMNKDGNTNFNLDIIWIDEKVTNQKINLI